MDGRNHRCECCLLARRQVLLESNIYWRCSAIDNRYGIRSSCKRLSKYVFCWEMKQKPFCQFHALLYVQHRTCLFCGSFCTQCSGRSGSSRFAVCVRNPELHWTHDICRKRNNNQCSHCYTTEPNYFRIKFVEELEEYTGYLKLATQSAACFETHVNILSVCNGDEQHQFATALALITNEVHSNQACLNGDEAVEEIADCLLKTIYLLFLGLQEGKVKLNEILNQILDRRCFVALVVLLQYSDLPKCNSYLNLAVEKNLPKFAKMLFLYKANDSEDLDFLFHALSHQFWDVAALFLEYGFREKFGGLCILHKAFSELTVEALYLLVNNGIGLYEVDDAGESVLHLFAKAKFNETDEHFIRMIMDEIPSGSCIVDLQDHAGYTPLDIAHQKKNWLMVECLLKKGAAVPTNSFFDCFPSDLMWLVEFYKKEYEPKRRFCLPRVFIDRDITKGKESVAVPVENSVFDDARIGGDFTYLSALIQVPFFSKKYDLSLACKCNRDCVQDCPCAWRPVYDTHGHLTDEIIRAAADGSVGTVIECSSTCFCSPDCQFKVAQKGIKVQLEIVRSTKYGWTVRSGERITKGQFVCEYTGEFITTSELTNRLDDSYIFEIEDGADVYCIDAKWRGNVSRFINHSCEPNLVVLRAVWDAYTQHIPHICFFARCDIDKGDEMTFDYGRKWWYVKSKTVTCKCGSETCKYKTAKNVNVQN